MKKLHQPRFVLVTRKTPLEQLVEQHGTVAQSRFYLESRGQDPAGYEEAHERLTAGLALASAGIPENRRRVRVDRSDLDRFLFSPDDIVLVVGQDGLVANTAKYLDGQLALGVNPDPERYDGVLCPHPPDAVGQFATWLENQDSNDEFLVERRVMCRAQREDGQELLALNEVFVGHQTHQSARYRIEAPGGSERHSSSGFICATGTGCTGWARSIAEQRGIETLVDSPEEARLAWFVREPVPSVFTGTERTFGLLSEGELLVLHSEMGIGGVVFADGIEADYLEFLDGQTVTLGIAERRLHLVVPAGKEPPR